MSILFRFHWLGRQKTMITNGIQHDHSKTSSLSPSSLANVKLRTNFINLWFMQTSRDTGVQWFMVWWRHVFIDSVTLRWRHYNSHVTKRGLVHSTLTPRVLRNLQPCILFFDEMDAFFYSCQSPNSGASNSEVRTCFLTEADWTASNNAGLIWGRNY